MSGLDNAMIINAAVLAAVLEADLGPHRRVGWFRIARPLLLVAVIVPIYLEGSPRAAPACSWRWPPPCSASCSASPRSG
jgi:hypothetical protein